MTRPLERKVNELEALLAAVLTKRAVVSPELSWWVERLMFRKCHTRPLWPGAGETWTDTEETELQSALAELPHTEDEPISTASAEELLAAIRQNMAGITPNRNRALPGEPLTPPPVRKGTEPIESARQMKQLPAQGALHIEPGNDRLADYRDDPGPLFWLNDE